MRIRVDCLGPSRQWFSRESFEVELPGAATTVGDVLARLASESSAFATRRASVAVALGEEVVGLGHPLSEGATLALIPPVSGG